MKTRVWSGAMALVVAVVMTGCAGAAEPSAAPEPSVTPPGSESTSPDSGGEPTPASSPDAAVPQELQFSATEVRGGASVNGEDFAGQATIFWFWAPWCPTCQFESVNVRAALEQLPAEVEMVGVAGLAPVEDMDAFIDDYSVDGMRHLADPDADIWSLFGVTTQPAYAFVGADGSIDVVIGIMSEADLVDRAEQLAAL